jgi:hypothetical protein
MADHLRTQIRDAALALVTGLTTTSTRAYAGRPETRPLQPTELPGLLCESFRTLAARDAYATGAGYRAGRDMRLIVHHREDGEIERYRCDARRLPST